MSELRIGKVGRKVFRLPLAVVTEASAVFGIRGTGKTVTGKKIVERLLERGAQVVVVDPVDAWWGLKSSADGKSDGFPVLVLGGNQGDLPLSPTSGAAVAEFVVRQRASVVLSLALMAPTEQKRFVADFAGRLYLLKAQQDHRTPVLVVIDEASMVVPQTGSRGGGKNDQGARASLAVTSLVRRGRSRGIGVLLIDQRPATVHKDVTTQVSMLVCHAVTGKRDLVALREWVELHDTGRRLREFEDGLAGLKDGHAWFWLPRAGIFERVAVDMVETFDSSKTPEFGEDPVLPEHIAEVDLDALREHMAEAIEQAEANDPAVLKRELTKARAQIRKLQSETPAPDPEALERAEERGRRAAAQAIDNRLKAMGRHSTKIQKASATIGEAAAAIAELCTNGDGGAVPKPTRDSRPVISRPERRPARRAPARSHVIVSDQKRTNLTRPHQRILGALAQLEALGVSRPSNSQVATLARYSVKGGSYNTYLSQLSTAGFVDRHQGNIELTVAGQAAIGDVDAPISLEELHRQWMDAVPGNPHRKLLAAILDKYPDEIHNEDLADATGYTASGGSFNTYLSKLSSLGLVERGHGYVRAAAVLFPEGLY